jgi:transposase
MYKITLSSDELLELEKLEKKHQWDWKILRRLRAIKDKNNGLSSLHIAEKLKVNKDTITNRTNLFKVEWFWWFCDLHYEWRRKSAYSIYKEEIEKMISENIYNSYIELRDAVEKKFNVGKKKHALWRFSKKKWIPAIKSAISNHETSQT